jgi:C1A family cysteine protease
MDDFLIHEESGLPYIDDGSGHKRILASLPATKSYAHIPTLASTYPLIPESQWVEFEDSDEHIPILDQDGHGSCVGHGSCSAFQVAWSQERGTPEKFSANYLYSLVNGGRDQGAVVGDAMDALMQDGICLDSTVPEGNVIYTKQMPSTAKTEAARFRAQLTYRVSTFAEIMSAIQMKRGVSIGIEIGRNFNPASGGVLPKQSGGGGGHCLCLRLGAKKINGIWYAKGQNSWGGKWGDAGRFWMESSFFNGSTDHFVVIQPYYDPQDPKKPPVAH